MDPIAVSPALLRNQLPDVPLREGATMMARVASSAEGKAVLVIAGMPLTAQVPPEIPAGATLKLLVAEVTAQRVTLQIQPQEGEAAPPAGQPAPPAPPPPGGYARPAPPPPPPAQAQPPAPGAPTPAQPAAPGTPAPAPGQSAPAPTVPGETPPQSGPPTQPATSTPAQAAPTPSTPAQPPQAQPAPGQPAHVQPAPGQPAPPAAPEAAPEQPPAQAQPTPGQPAQAPPPGPGQPAHAHGAHGAPAQPAAPAAEPDATRPAETQTARPAEAPQAPQPSLQTQTPAPITPAPPLPPELRAQLEVEEAPQRRQGSDVQPAHVVSLAFNSPTLGRLDLRLELRGERVLAEVTTPAGRPHVLASNGAERLRANLEAAGLEATVKVRPRGAPLDLYA